MSSLFVCQLLPSNRSLGVESSPYCHLQHNNKYSARNNFLRISNSLNQERDALVDNEGNNIQQINPKHIPKHIGVIMDGNRRWAKARVLPVQEGHKFLTPNLINICKVSSKLGIQVVTAFAASTENLKRDKEEIDFLKQHFEELFDEILRVGVRVSVIGDRSKYPVNLLKQIELAEETTKDNTELHLLVALNYGGQHDIMQATKSIASKVKDGLLQLEDIDNKVFEQELFTKCAKFPIPDLIIRTGGEQRISNFLLWQLAYSELYFTKTLFPDFGEEDLKEAILSFQRRHRRFGGHTY